MNTTLRRIQKSMRSMLTAIGVISTLLLNAQAETKTDADGCLIFEMQEEDTTYIMKQYFLVILKSGEAEVAEEKLAEIQAGHMAHIQTMDEAGILSLAGPFGHDGEKRGIFIMNVPSEEEVRKWVEQDPAFQAGRLAYEIYPWWGAKGSTLK